MEYRDLLREIESRFDYLKYHSKNLTKKQELAISELQDYIHELTKLVRENNEKL